MNIYGISDKGGYGIFDQAKQMVRLSEGLDSDQFLKPEPIKRTLSALKHFKSLIDINNVEEIYALSTAAVRIAKNQSQFLEKVKSDTALEFTVLTGEQETYYDYLGVINTISIDNAILLDVGGASIEIGWIKNRKLMSSVCLPYGSVTLTEHFLSIKSRKKRFEAVESFLIKELEKTTWVNEAKGLPIIGLGGINRSVAKIDIAKNQLPLNNLHNYHMKKDVVEEIISLIHGLEPSELEKVDGINKKRADIMPVGIMPLKVMMDIMGSHELIISADGLKDGYFYEKYFEKKGIPIVVDNVLKHSTINIMRRFTSNPAHHHKVEELTLSLFDSTSELHDFGLNEKKVLSVAALLHDIGVHVEYNNHNLHGMYLILNGRIDGLTYLEQMKVSYLVAIHRGGVIKDRFRIFEGFFSKDELTRLQKLGIFLQLAEQLDRSEVGNVSDLKVEIKGDKVFVKLESKEYPGLDIESAMLNSYSFKKFFNKDILIYA